MRKQIPVHLEALGWDMKRLSTEAGLNTSAVRDIMAGKSMNPRLDTVRAIAGALGITVSELIGETASPPKAIPRVSDDDREWLLMGRTVPQNQRAAVRQAIATIMLMGPPEDRRYTPPVRQPGKSPATLRKPRQT